MHKLFLPWKRCCGLQIILSTLRTNPLYLVGNHVGLCRKIFSNVHKNFCVLCIKTFWTLYTKHFVPCTTLFCTLYKKHSAFFTKHFLYFVHTKTFRTLQKNVLYSAQKLYVLCTTLFILYPVQKHFVVFTKNFLCFVQKHFALCKRTFYTLHRNFFVLCTK